MAATVNGILLTGTHAARPTSGLVKGTLYACSDHGLIYQTSDDGTTWGTWLTPGVTLDFGEAGDIGTLTIGAAASAGSSGEVADAGHVHPFPSAATITAALDWGESGDVAASAPGDTAAAGVLDEVARADHRHAREAASSIDFGESGDIAASAPGDTVLAGSTGEVADAGHRHARATERVVYEFVIDGGGSAITTGVKGDLYVPDAFTVTGVVMLADQSGSIVVDIWNDTYANYPPTDADSLPGAGTPPTISSATKSKDTTLTSWDTSVPADSTLRFNVDSATTVTRVVVAIFGYRS
jgi:hypothetical protein